MCPVDASPSQRASPGRIGRPAASADVQVAGRSAFERRSRSRPSRRSSRLPCVAARTARRACSCRGRRSARGGRRRRRCGRPRSARSPGSGTGPCRSRRRSRSATRDFGVVLPCTTTYGMPIREPSQRPEPKSACTPLSTPIEAMIVAEFAATGSCVDALVPGIGRREHRSSRRVLAWSRLRRPLPRARAARRCGGADLHGCRSSTSQPSSHRLNR